MLKYLVLPVALIAGVAVAHNVISRHDRIPVVTAAGQEKPARPAAIRKAEQASPAKLTAAPETAPAATRPAPRPDPAKPDTTKVAAPDGAGAATGKETPVAVADPKEDTRPSPKKVNAEPAQADPEAEPGQETKAAAMKPPAEKAGAQKASAKPAAVAKEIVERDPAQFDTEKMTLPADANPPLVKRDDAGTIGE